MGSSIQSQLAYCGRELDSWGKHLSHQITERIKAQKLILRQVCGCRDTTSLHVCWEAEKELNRLLKCEEDFWRQLSKLFWLRTGDCNTTAFHRFANDIRKKQVFSKLQTDDGVWVDKSSGLNDLVRQYFVTLYERKTGDVTEITSNVVCKVTISHNERLIAPYSAEEVKEAVFSMHNNKAPGEDGFNPAFYKHHWSIVGQSVTSACLNWLEAGRLPEGINNTNVVLIPKKNQPSNMKELRPIALCNVLYKIVFKVIANRLRQILPEIIDEAQSGFVSGRLITDNIVVANEVLHWLKAKRRGKLGMAVLKIDIAKAYDKLEWNFLEQMLSALGFCSKWIFLVMNCVRSVKYNVIVGEEMVGPIILGRGIRQCDHLSPFLFILAAEGLTSLIRRKERAGLWHGCRVANTAPSVSHLFFADDAFLFFRATPEECNVVKDILRIYGQASGQTVNFLKSSIIYSSNESNDLRTLIGEMLNVTTQDGPCKYLGLPLTFGRQRKRDFDFVKGKFQQRISAWHYRGLSRADKEVLLKSIAQALPTYCMSLYLLSDTLCDELHRLMNSFWWGGCGDTRGIKWMKWEKMCIRKEAGGLGFRDLKDFNRAMLSKQGWRIVSNPNSLMAKVLKARYFRNLEFWESKLGDNPSAIWRSIWTGSDIIRQGSRMRVGDGRNIKVWKDPWLPCLENGLLSTHMVPSMEDLRVSDLMFSGSRSWDVAKISDIFNERDKELILSIPLSTRNSSDSWYWLGDKSGSYSVKSGYRAIHDYNEGRFMRYGHCWKVLWKIKVVPKMLNLVWRASTNSLPTRSRLRQKQVIAEEVCPVCNQGEETILHSLVTCEFSTAVWRVSGLGWAHGNMESFSSWLELILSCTNSERWGDVVAVCWGLWKHRNDLVWRGKRMSPRVVLAQCLGLLRSWREANHQVIEVDHCDSSFLSADVVWYKPQPGYIKLNVDAGVFQNSGAVGLVRRDHDGRFLGAHVSNHPFCRDSSVLEVLTIREALTWIKQRNLSRVIVESDCLVAVKAIHSSTLLDSQHGLLICDCKDLLSTLPNVRVVFIRRTANLVAHSLVRAIGSKPGLHVWGSELLFVF